MKYPTHQTKRLPKRFKARRPHNQKSRRYMAPRQDKNGVPKKTRKQQRKLNQAISKNACFTLFWSVF